ncbi:arfB [Symbiodinium necroappetens]|uniref:ArfB protein n=1 Tax=Symbiodinium necroappetens TaxID=1628268 RepID=A0A812KAF3_9DINO|nr:arfB [Symbiodinium necroappetens]
MPEPTPTPPADTPPPGSIRLAPGVRIDEGKLTFVTSRSSGPGGQNVNKRETKVELRVSIDDIPLKPDARARLKRLAGSRLTDEGILQITAEDTRSQRRNRELTVARLAELVAKALTRPARRVRTKPTKGSIRRRLDEKTRRGQRKAERSRNKGRGHDE